MRVRELLLEVAGEIEVVYGEDGGGERMGRGAEGLGEGDHLDGCCQIGRWEVEEPSVAQDGTFKSYRQPKGA